MITFKNECLFVTCLRGFFSSSFSCRPIFSAIQIKECVIIESSSLEMRTDKDLIEILTMNGVGKKLLQKITRLFTTQ